ncbi:MAG: hypothetical protein OEM60_02665 [Gammaproteobacteria bacterium]|nr:hypothetical protein [Gammaproteobacteria bacterium]MDH3432741.1 hypothetical protein [Gammaproteobacteria bacterium]
MTLFRRQLRRAVLLLLLPLASAQADSGTVFARIATDDDDRPRALQMSIVTYAPRDDASMLSVDLISAIHIGDRSYYTELNERFSHYDVLLYELVAPQDAVVSNRLEKRKGFLSTAQLGMTKMLDLSFQLDEIDYDQANFVHADLSPAELRQSMEERGESLYVYFWRIVFASLDEYARDPLGLKDWELISAMLSSDQGDSLKTLIAYEMTNIEQVQDILGEDSSSAVIGARNQRAIDVLQREIDSGSRRIGIFYGVAHMPDLEERLQEQVGLTYEKTTWVDAWKLGAGATNDTAE